MSVPPYVLTTPAHNEEAHIERTLRAVVSQTIRPLRWAIVSDGSTDRTDEIVKGYAARHEFIEFVRRERSGSADFASKIHAFRLGMNLHKGLPYQFVGNLDADMSFEPDYFEKVLARMAAEPKVGIGGGGLEELIAGKRQPIINDVNTSVCGAVQFFRRECFEAIGGLMPLKRGSEDAVAEAMARMKGWQTRTFPEVVAMHHRHTGARGGRVLAARFHQGRKERYRGNHPLFELAKCLHRMRERPYVIGGILRFCGYLREAIHPEAGDSIPDDVTAFVRREQLRRMKRFVFRGKSADNSPSPRHFGKGGQ